MSMVRHHSSTPEELRERLAAERVGMPFLLYRTIDGQRLLTLGDELAHATLGRGERCAVRLELDPEISRLHAELRRIGDEWVIADDGLSRNGTFVNEERLVVRRRLVDGDVIRCGSAVIDFYDPLYRASQGTRPASEHAAARLSDTQRRVLVALCQPLRDGEPYALPASNQAIAEKLHLSIGGVKGHLRTLFEKLEVDPELPHNHKRLRLAERAVESGLIKVRELQDGTGAGP